MCNQRKKSRLSSSEKNIDWELIDDLLPAIGEKLGSIESHDSFACVCRKWRAAVNTEHRKHTTFEHPHLMLPEAEQGVREVLTISSSSSGNPRKISLPEATGKRCLSWRDWLLVFDKDGHHSSLLHPVSHVQIHLPKKPYNSIRKVVLSANPTTTSNFDVVVMFGGRHLGICRPGDTCWTILKPRDWDTGISYISDIIYFNSRIYAVDFKGRVFIPCVSEHSPCAYFHQISSVEKSRVACQKFYLAEVSNKLFVVRRDIDDSGEQFVTKEFKCYEVNLKHDPQAKVECKPVETEDFLWNKALFLGYDSCFSVECADYNHCKANCIYFAKCNMSFYYGYKRFLGIPGKDMGIYHLSDGSIEPLFDGIACNAATPPTWIGPGF